MSKVVTIPTYQPPFVVMVNGVKYVFPAGSVQEVPDEVAVVIEANSRKKPEEPVDAPFDCCEGGGSGGGTQSDWNQTDSSAADFIKNKPFGDEVVEILPPGDAEFTWDDGMEFYVTRVPLASPLNVGDTLTVTWEGAKYSCELASLFGMLAFGNLMGEEGLEPFMGAVSDGTLVLGDIYATGDVTRNVSIINTAKRKISADYLPVSTAFYNNIEDEYLYTDLYCTTKATAEEVMAAMPNFVISIVGMITCTPVSVFDNGYVRVAYISGATNNFGTVVSLYTAEYVPETTE